MKIAFWSNSPGKSGVTGNLSCISILSAMSEPSRMVLFENHASMNNLGSTFLNQNSYDVLHEKQSYFVENGLGRIFIILRHRAGDGDCRYDLSNVLVCL